jgi:endonuclease/exonuclease/phosphatase family metal-dependent hydrolase
LENIATCGADIICLQEFNTWQNKPGYPENLQEILNRTGITQYFFHKVFENRKKTRSFGLIIFSKFPIIGSGHLEYPAVSALNTTIWADLVIHGDTVRIYSTHLQSNQLTHSDFEFIHQTADSDTMDFEPKRVAGKFKSSYLLRAEQVEVITSAIQASPYPLIFVGDFNDTPVSYAYRQISSGLSDVFLNCGRGLGATYIPFPFIRIDYMLFTPENFHAVDYTRIKSGGSDHYMIEATFGILP